MSGKILIVDDVATNRIVYKVKLGAACYAPLLAADGKSCLAMARSEKPDLILLDLVLPDMSGTQVLHHLRADPATANIPVVVFSAEADSNARLAALAAGADDFLTKSIDDQTLMARLRNLLRGREALSELENGTAPLRGMGFAEPATAFDLPGTVALVTHRPETALRWQRNLAGTLPDRMVLLSREAALSDNPHLPPPDVYVIESDLADPMGGLRLMSELRSRTLSRHAAICIVKTDAGPGDAAMAFDLGANEVVVAGMDPREFGLRITRLMRRKRTADRMRASVRNGLRMALIDPLTGLYNRRYALSRLAEVATSAQATQRPFAVMVLDLDRFKEVNDHHGHPAGDAVLTEVARRMSVNIRQNDLLARIGGEEFLIALPETDLEQANLIAQRLCDAVQETPFAVPGAAPLHLTASIGLATWTGAHRLGQSGSGRNLGGQNSVSDVIDRADQALLTAKSAGRNRVTIGRSAA